MLDVSWYDNINIFQDLKDNPYIKNLEILVFLLDEKLLIELFYEIHFLIPMKEMVESFENCAILYWKNLKRNMATSFIKNQQHDAWTASKNPKKEKVRYIHIKKYHPGNTALVLNIMYI